MLRQAGERALRKDYISVSEEAARRDDSRFVSDFWSAIWEKRNFSQKLTDSVKQREEYRIMKPYIQELAQGSKILDGGCGLGEWTVFLSSQKYNVYGLDISSSTIDRLKEHFPNEQFIAEDIRKTGFPDGYFDAYFSWGAFEHFEEGLSQCLEEAYRIIKPGGYLFLTVPFHNERHWRADKRAYRRSISKLSYISNTRKGSLRFYQWRLTQLELKQELEMHGFNTISIIPIHKDEGLSRYAQHTFKAEPGTRVHFLLKMVLGLIVTRHYVAHMLMAIGRRQ